MIKQFTWFSQMDVDLPAGRLESDAPGMVVVMASNADEARALLRLALDSEPHELDPMQMLNEAPVMALVGAGISGLGELNQRSAEYHEVEP